MPTERPERRATDSEVLDRAVVVAVDDEPAVLNMLRRVLSCLPIHLQCCGGGEAAIEAIGREVPSVVVSDHNMPGMTGLELLQRIHARWPAVSLVLHTGDPAAQLHAAQMGFDTIEKGASADAVRALVGRLAGCSPL